MFRKHRARKRFGQHFLKDYRIIEQIIKVISPKADDLMVEVGPGLGALTSLLLPLLNQLHVVEIDRDLVAKLEQKILREKEFSYSLRRRFRI